MHRTIYFLVLFFVATFAVTPPPEEQDHTFNKGDIVGVRASEYEVGEKVGHSLSQIPMISIVLICNAVENQGC